MRQPCRGSPSARGQRRATEHRRTIRHRSPTRVDITVRQPQAVGHARSPEDLAQEVLDGVSFGPAARRAEPIDLGPWRHTAPPAEPATAADTATGPGGSQNPDGWPAMWTTSEARLEPLSRALAAALRHDKDLGGCLTLEECRLLESEHWSPWEASGVLLVGAMSMRRCGQRRFEVFLDEAGQYTVEAQAKELDTDAANRRPRRIADRRSAAGTTRAQLDAEMDGWQQGADGATPGASSREPAAPMQAKLKRKRGSRGNPNRPSQVARSARLAYEK